MKTVKEVIDHNIAVPGEGLRFGMQTTCEARCSTGKHVLRTGLGAMGVGSMWLLASADDAADPDFDKLPVKPCGANDRCLS